MPSRERRAKSTFTEKFVASEVGRIKNDYLNDRRHSVEVRARASARRRGVECNEQFLADYGLRVEREEQESRERRERQILRSRGISVPNRRTLERLQRKPPNAWNEDLGAKYGLDEEQYNALLEEQHGACPVCRRTMDHAHRVVRLHIDQCPHTGQIRGLLCARCRKAIELLGDNALVLTNAAAYLSAAMKKTQPALPPMVPTKSEERDESNGTAKQSDRAAKLIELIGDPRGSWRL